MNQAKLHSAIEALPAISQKIYAVTPIRAAWTATQISNEQARQYGTHQPLKTTQGVLYNLIERGLVREPEPHKFQRVPVKSKKTTKTTPQDTDMPHKKPELDYKKTPLDNLVTLADNARELAKVAEDLATRIELLRHDIENAALDLESQFQASEEKSLQLTQLKALLKNITD